MRGLELEFSVAPAEPVDLGRGTLLVLASIISACAMSTTSAQESSALYDASVVQLGPYGPGFDRLLDLDADGDFDALGLSVAPLGGQALLRLYTNDGSGLMSSSWDGLLTDSAIDEFATTAIGDIDGDGAPDIMLGGGEKIWAWRINGAGDPSPLSPLTVPPGWGRVRDLVSADFDDDGQDDIAAVLENRIAVWFVSPTWLPGGFPQASLLHPLGESIESLAVMNLDGDSGADLVAVSGPNGQALHLLSFQGQALVVGGAYSHGLLDPHPAAGDIDGDGDDDLVLFDGSASFRVLRQTASGMFDLEALAHGGPAQLLVDIDNDGDLDGVGSTNASSTPHVSIPNVTPSQFLVALNSDGLGGFDSAFEIEGLGAARLAGAEDLDGDGDIDLIGGRAAYFPKLPIRKDPTPSLGSFGNEHLPSDVYDVDRDGDPDAELEPHALLSNRGDGSYSQSEPLIEPAPPGTWITGPTFVGDWDGDSDVDMIVLQWSDGNDEPIQRLLVNAGGGYFKFGPEATPPGELIADPSQAGVHHKGIPEDADGDGDVDLIYTSLLPSFLSGPDSTDLWINDGGGLFTKLWSSSEGTFVALEDFDGDSVHDLVLAHQVLGLGWKQGLGGGLFGPISWFGGVGYIDSVHGGVGVADFDNDQDTDLFVISDLTTLVFIENDGGGAFTEHVGVLPDVLPFSGATDRSILGSDANGDGLVDLIVSPAGNSTKTSLVYPYIGPGASWGTPVEQVFLPHAQVDVDGDGDEDLIGYEVVDNNIYAPPFSGERRQYGSGSAGTGGAVPVLGAAGPMRFGEAPEIRLTGGLGGTAAILALGISEVALENSPFPGMTSYVNPLDIPFVMVPLSLTGPYMVAGEGELLIPVGVTLSMINGLYSHQFFLFDPASPTLLTHSNGLMLLYGG